MEEMIEQIMDLIEVVTDEAYAQGVRRHGHDRMPDLERRLEVILSEGMKDN